jgi:hypothetical protein
MLVELIIVSPVIGSSWLGEPPSAAPATTRSRPWRHVAPPSDVTSTRNEHEPWAGQSFTTMAPPLALSSCASVT